MNLLNETLEEMEPFTPDDIVFIGSTNGQYRCTWPEFQVLADREYYEGFGSSEVAHDLIIIFKDGTRLRRWIYDGSEKWCKDSPVPQGVRPLPIKSLFTESVS